MKTRVGLIALLLCAGFTFADEQYIFHLRNGQRLVGEVAQENVQTIVIETRDGRVTLKREEIKSRSLYPVNRESLNAAEEAILNRHYLDAITSFHDAYKQAKGEIRREGQQKIEEAADQWVRQSSQRTGADLDWADADKLSQIEGLIESADVLERLKAEVRRIYDVRARYLLSVAQRLANEKKYDKAAEIYRDLQNHGHPHPEELAKVYFKHAVESISPPTRDRAKALRLLLRACETDAEFFPSYLYLADVYLELRDVDKAKKALREARKYASQFTGHEKQLFQQLSRRLTWVSKFPTFAPIPTVSPKEVIHPKRTRKEKIRHWRLQMEWLYRTGRWKEALRKSWMYIAGAFVAILFLWFLPWRYVRRDSFRRTLTGPNWRTVVFFTGILGLGVYLVARAVQEGRKPRCKRCGYNLARAGDYTDYDYSHCPGCKAPIRPIFSLTQEIISRARLLTSGEAPSSLETGSEEELFHLLCLHAFRSRADCVNLEPDGKDLGVTFRVDGIGHRVYGLPERIGRILFPVARKKANIDSSTPFPQTGYFMGSLDDADVEVRLTITPGDLGESLSLRLVDRRRGLPNLAQLGLSADQQAHLRGELEKPSGMIVIVGPPGSGKTTLAYAMLAHLNDGQHYLATLENPIRLELPGVTQVNEGTGGLRGKPALEAMIRQNVNVLFVKEIYDRESVEILLQASRANRRSIICLESSGAVNGLERFLSNELSPETLGNGLSMIVGIRLIRKLCSVCKTEAKLRPRDVQRLGLTPDQVSTARLFIHKGCDACLQTGYSGRTGVCEILPITDPLRKAILSGQTKEEIVAIAASAHLGSLREHAMQKVLAGVTDLDELARVVGSVAGRQA